MNEENNELMTNRQLSQLCAKGLCEWCSKDKHIRSQIVHNDYKYLLSDSDNPVSEQIVIRPFEKDVLMNVDNSEWYIPTKIAFDAILGRDKASRIFGF